MLLGEKCFPPKFTKIYLLLFNICISTKSNIHLFHLDVLFQIFEVDHCLGYSYFLFLHLFLICSYPFLLSCPPLAPECPSLSGNSVTEFDSFKAILLYAAAAQSVLLGISLLQLFPYFLHFLKKKKKKRSEIHSYSMFSVDHLSRYVTGNKEAIRAGLLFSATKSCLP